MDPYRTYGVPNHSLTGELAGYRALDMEWHGAVYRLIYCIYESPPPRRVVILSLAEHTPAPRQPTESPKTTESPPKKRSPRRK